jgi:hypothetical protein
MGWAPKERLDSSEYGDMEAWRHGGSGMKWAVLAVLKENGGMGAYACSSSSTYKECL